MATASAKTGPDAPCAGVEGPSSGAALTVEDTEGGDRRAVHHRRPVRNFCRRQLEGSSLRNGWIGLELNGDEAGNGTGIFLDPGSEGATIGGVRGPERNVIAGNDWTAHIEGRKPRHHPGQLLRGQPSGAVGLPGGSQEIANAKDIEITDSTAGGGIKAENNEIGETIEGPARPA